MGRQDRETIEVNGVCEEELAAEAVDLFVTVEGSSLVTGRAALSKAKEVASLIEGLRATGMSDEAVELVSVSAEIKSGMLGRSSSATYEVRVRCEDLELLPAYLGAITSAKNARLGHLAWRYPKCAESDGRLLAAAAANGRVKAKAIAEALGVRVGELVEAREVTQNDRSEELMDLGGAGGLVRRRAPAAIDIGVQMQHRKKLRREVRLSYAILAG